MKNKGILIIISWRIECNHIVSTISQFRLAKTINTTVNFDILLPSDKGILEPTVIFQLHILSRQHPSQRLRTVGEIQTYFVETNRRSRCMNIMGSSTAEPIAAFPTKVSKGAKIRNRYNQVLHLTQDTNGKVTNSKSYMLPLFNESHINPAMVRHGMKVLHQSINYINLDQTPEYGS